MNIAFSTVQNWKIIFSKSGKKKEFVCWNLKKTGIQTLITGSAVKLEPVERW